MRNPTSPISGNGENVDVPGSREEGFGQQITKYIGGLVLDGKTFEMITNARLYRALEVKFFEDQRDTIKFRNLARWVADYETQAKIEVVNKRLVKQFDYNETSASDVRNQVASIFPRGGSKGGSPGGGHGPLAYDLR